MGAPPDPTPCISCVPELLRAKAKQQESLSPGVLGKLRHKNLCFSIRNEVTEQENIKYPRIEEQSSLARDGHVGDCSSLRANGSG